MARVRGGPYRVESGPMATKRGVDAESEFHPPSLFQHVDNNSAPNLTRHIRILRIGGCLCLASPALLLESLSRTLEHREDAPHNPLLRFVILGQGPPKYADPEEKTAMRCHLSALLSSLRSTFNQLANANPGAIPPLHVDLTPVQIPQPLQQSNPGTQATPPHELPQQTPPSARDSWQGSSQSCPSGRSSDSSAGEIEASQDDTWQPVGRPGRRRVTGGKLSEAGVWDLEGVVQASELPLPTINGWLLGYPVLYCFRKELGVQAGQCLASCTLHLHQLSLPCIPLSLLAGNGGVSSRGGNDLPRLLMSFTVPSTLSLRGLEEPFIKPWMANIRERQQDRKEIWAPPRLEIEIRFLQHVVL